MSKTWVDNALKKNDKALNKVVQTFKSCLEKEVILNKESNK